MRVALLAALGYLMLAACSSMPPQVASTPEPSASAPQATPTQPAAPRRGAYYKDDGPGDTPPPDITRIPDAEPKSEPLHRWANRPYEVFGKAYAPITDASGFTQRGRASWYGRRFHGQQTSSGEPYDMYAMTGAHPTLPIPSYVRVTNLGNGRSVVVRINDRGPFHSERVLDLSYTAAAKLGYVEAGSALVEIAVVSAGDTRIAAKPAPPAPSVAEAPQSAPAGVYLQLGTFSARDNAESFRARIYRQLAWLSEQVLIVPAVAATGTAFRLHLGPFRSRSDAQPIAERIRSELNFSPVFVTR